MIDSEMLGIDNAERRECSLIAALTMNRLLHWIGRWIDYSKLLYLMNGIIYCLESIRGTTQYKENHIFPS